ncbi:MAG TPA: hypothetical protein VJ979_01435 [Actinomycetota bacterium]|nr:hypothetical protein [Actinomycetota bacterium]
MRGSRSTMLLATALLLAACTTGDDAVNDVPSATPQVPASPSVEAPVTTLASGEALPAGCDRGTPHARQTVAFVADGRAWALDPEGARLTCLFRVRDPGPFAWGPQGDRVLLGDLAVRGLEPGAPTFPAAADASPIAFDWGHPIGLAVVFAARGDPTPDKRFMDDGRIEPLGALPDGRYLDVAYHPSGLALAFVIDRQGEQSIWLSTNEGEEPVRLVFSKGGTRFTSIAFTPGGERLVWTAQHAGGYSQIHTMALDRRTGFTDGWRGDGLQASNLSIAPRGRSTAIDVGTGCADRTATIVLGPRVGRPALPDASEPSTAIGWLDRSTLLVGVGGCREPLDLVAVDVAGNQTPLVLGAQVAATRTVTTSAPDSVPAPPVEAEEEPPPGGVG